MILSKEFRFEASHQIHNHPGKCARLHGHSWKLSVAVEGRLRPDTGMVMDYNTIKSVVQPLVDRLDHRHLGWGAVEIEEDWGKDLKVLPSTVYGFNMKLPTSENLLIWIVNQLPESFPWIHLCLNETCTSEAVLMRDDWEQLYKEKKMETDDENSETQDSEGQEATPGSDQQKSQQEDAVNQDPVEQTKITDEDLPKNL